MAAHILKKNAELGSSQSRGDVKIALEGLALGNPWVDPPNQYDVSDFAHGLGFLSVGQKYRLKEQEQECKAQLKKGRLNQRVCFSLMDSVLDATATRTSERLLMYDVRKFSHNTKAFPPGHEDLERYLNRADVLEALHIKGLPHKYEECADPPYNALSHQDGKGATTELAAVLDAGIRVLIYSGQFDLVCHHLGTEKMLDALPWSGQAGFQQARSGVWEVDRKPAGFCRSHNNLQLLLVLDSGHMVPMDLPSQSLIMISRFLRNKVFSNPPMTAVVPVLAPPRDRDCPPRTKHMMKRGGAVAGTGTGTGGKLSTSIFPIYGRRLSATATSSSSATSASASSSSSSLSSPAHVMIAHAIPLDRAVALRLRASSVALASLNWCVQIFVEPGDQLLSVPWLNLTQPSSHGHGHSHVDLVVDQLLDGREYSFTVRSCHPNLSPPQILSRRAVTVRPGCYSALRSQCCGHGECVPATSTVTTEHATCVCDAGFSGLHCDYYQVSLAGGVKSNVSAGNLCAAGRAFASNHTFRLKDGSGQVTPVLQTRTNAHAMFHSDPNPFSSSSSSSLSASLERKRHCAENSSCSLVLELELEPKATATWLYTLTAQGAHSTALLSVTQADLTQAILTIGSHHNSSSSSSRGSKNRDKVRATVSFGHRSATSVSLSPSAPAPSSPSQISRQTVFVKLDGPSAAAVDDVAQGLLKQLQDDSSALRRGLVTQYLRPQLIKATYTSASSHGQSHHQNMRRMDEYETEEFPKVSYLDVLVRLLAAVGTVFLLQMLWKVCAGFYPASDRSSCSVSSGGAGAGRGSETQKLFRSNDSRRE